MVTGPRNNKFEMWTERTSKEVTAVVNIKIKPVVRRRMTNGLDAFWYQREIPGYPRNKQPSMKQTDSSARHNNLQV